MKPFSGNPRIYRRAALLIALYCGLSVYLAFALVKYGVQGDTWVFGWKALLVPGLFIPLYYRFCLRWIMRLDAQYGSGSRWKLVSTTVKLPELRQH